MRRTSPPPVQFFSKDRPKPRGFAFTDAGQMIQKPTVDAYLDQHQADAAILRDKVKDAIGSIVNVTKRGNLISRGTEMQLSLWLNDGNYVITFEPRSALLIKENLDMDLLAESIGTFQDFKAEFCPAPTLKRVIM